MRAFAQPTYLGIPRYIPKKHTATSPSDPRLNPSPARPGPQAPNVVWLLFVTVFANKGIPRIHLEVFRRDQLWEVGPDSN